MSESDAPQGVIIGESIPMAMVCGMLAGLLFALIMMICHIQLAKCLVKSRLKQIPRARKVKVKKGKKGKKSKKGKKKKRSGTTGGTTGGSGTTRGSTEGVSTTGGTFGT